MKHHLIVLKGRHNFCSLSATISNIWKLPTNCIIFRTDDGNLSSVEADLKVSMSVYVGLCLSGLAHSLGVLNLMALKVFFFSKFS